MPKFATLHGNRSPCLRLSFSCSMRTVQAAESRGQRPEARETRKAHLSHWEVRGGKGKAWPRPSCLTFQGRTVMTSPTKWFGVPSPPFSFSETRALKLIKFSGLQHAVQQKTCHCLKHVVLPAHASMSPMLSFGLQRSKERPFAFMFQGGKCVSSSSVAAEHCANVRSLLRLVLEARSKNTRQGQEHSPG